MAFAIFFSQLNTFEKARFPPRLFLELARGQSAKKSAINVSAANCLSYVHTHTWPDLQGSGLYFKLKFSSIICVKNLVIAIKNNFFT